MEIDTSIPLDDWRAVPQAAQRAEALGFGGVMAPEIQNDPFIPLAFAAAATERIRLGTAVAIAFPRSPMIVANLGYDLQRNSGGRFVLGLGTQVKGHNERRFSVRWESPGPRLKEYVEALRAIWTAWERKEPLRYEGKFYQFTLMTPEFAPPPTGMPPVPVTIAAVQPYMLRLSGEACDGVRLHGFCTRRYLAEVALPAIEEGLRRAEAFARGELKIEGDGLGEPKAIGVCGGAAINFFFPYANTKAADVLRLAAGSGVLAMTGADYAHPEVGPLMDKWLVGPGIDAKRRLELMKLAWDMTGSEFGSRAGLYERLYSGDPEINAQRWFRSGITRECESLVHDLLKV